MMRAEVYEWRMLLHEYENNLFISLGRADGGAYSVLPRPQVTCAFVVFSSFAQTTFSCFFFKASCAGKSIKAFVKKKKYICEILFFNHAYIYKTVDWHKSRRSIELVDDILSLIH